MRQSMYVWPAYQSSAAFFVGVEHLSVAGHNVVVCMIIVIFQTKLMFVHSRSMVGWMPITVGCGTAIKGMRVL